MFHGNIVRNLLQNARYMLTMNIWIPWIPLNKLSRTPIV